MDFLPIRRNGHFLQLTFMVGCILSLQQCLSAASESSGSLKAELFHRDHPASPFYSGTLLDQLSKLQDDLQRSTERVESLFRRRTLSAPQNFAVANIRSDTEYSTTPNTTASLLNRKTTWDTNVTDIAIAEYVMSISLGTPAQNFVAVADTGSDLTWLQCLPCENCFTQTAPIYDPSLSSTFSNLSCSSTGCDAFRFLYNSVPTCAADVSPHCEYSYFYGDGSNTTGIFASETLNLVSTSGENFSLPDFWFGCSHSSFSQSALFDSMDGLVGLGQGNVSLPRQLAHVFEDKFSYCLVNRTLTSVQSSPLVFGKDAARTNLSLQWTPILSNPLMPIFYFIGIEGLTVNGVSVKYNSSAFKIDPTTGNGGTFLDSGTTFTSLDSRAFQPLVTAIEHAVPSSYPLVNSSSGFTPCYNVSTKPTFQTDIPTIAFILAGHATWTLDFDNAWHLEGDDTICSSLTEGGVGTGSILGNIQQQDFYVEFDRIEHRIGFAKTDCGALADEFH